MNLKRIISSRQTFKKMLSGVIWQQMAKCIFILLCYLGSGSPVFAQIDTAHGASLFQRCSGCHKLDIQLVGPALGPQITEETDDQYLVRWIHNSQALITAGEPRAVAIYNRFNQSVMPAFTDFSEKDISDILGYVRAKWKSLQGSPDNERVNNGKGAENSDDIKSKILFASALCLSVLCLIVVLLLSRALKLTERMLRQSK